MDRGRYEWCADSRMSVAIPQTPHRETGGGHEISEAPIP
jgi:hypothetical protein